MGGVFFPLDEELALPPGSLSPYLHEAVVRLGTWMPFERVPSQLQFFAGSRIALETARRLTEEAGRALVAVETREAERLERELPEGPDGPALQQFSADGAMVPLVGGEWTEVKTLGLGTVDQRLTKEGQQVAHATDLAYFSRLAEAEQFGHLATVATHAAGTTRAQQVCAVVDGAEWLQGLIDLHCPQAVRILDFPHAAEYLAKAARAAFGEGSPAATAWLDQQQEELGTGDPDVVLAAIAAVPTPTLEAQETREQVLAYLTKRRAQIRYAAFRAAGYPIGDGMVESANKLVVEQRLKGSGMHWARHNVNPMVALRACVCSDHWEAGWTSITVQLRQHEAERRAARPPRRQLEHAAPEPAPPPVPVAPAAPPAPEPPTEKLVVNGRPTANHPWRSFRLPGSPDFPPPAKL